VKDKQKCCKCNAANVKAAIPAFAEVSAEAEMEPSFVEVMAGIQHSIQNGAEECCPCPKGKGRKSRKN
jgi:hypothetical protein